MGNLFGTCLGAEDIYAFSAIANAVELNKRVLYVKDSNGNIIGRELIGLTAAGKLIGFRTYGAVSIWRFWRMECPRIWIKLHCDLACLRLVQSSGAQLEASDDDEVAEKLRLGAAWYNDGPEAFDWWLVNRRLAPMILQGDRETVALGVLRFLHERGSTDTPFEDLPTLRALLWLEGEAELVLANLPRSFLTGTARHYLWLHSRSQRVRELMKR